MIINRNGAEYEYSHHYYKIGETIIATEKSEYAGLVGVIFEIRDGEDKETENDTPDFYCAFEPPVLPQEVEKLEQVFSALYGTPKKLEDISLDMVIMAPEMIRPYHEIQTSGYTTDIWIVMEDWAINDMCDTDTHLFSNRESAELHLRRLINEFFTYDNPATWRTEPNFEEEAGELYYKAWLDGDYRENHYEVAIIRKTMDLTWDYIHKVGQMNNEAYAKEDMLTRITEEDSEIEATDEERQKLIELVNDTDVEGLIEDKLGSADLYWERYWSAVNDAARDLLKGVCGQDE